MWSRIALTKSSLFLAPGSSASSSASICRRHCRLLHTDLIRSQLYIDGKWVHSELGKKFTTINPATGKEIAKVHNATAADVDKAVAAARACLYSKNWGYNSTGKQRAVILRKLGEIITREKENLARLDSFDEGKPLREAMADMSDAIVGCEHFAKLAEELDGKQGVEKIENGTNGDFDTTILYEPIGVIGAITPWNYPFLMGIWKCLPAVAAGCTVVLKPSELAPLSCMALAEMFTEAGLPAGALNVIPGLGADAGNPLTTHSGIDKISFTGSVPTARRIMAAAAAGPRAISLELGGKSPLIVFEDAEIDGAVDWIITGIVWGSGQVCSATSRVFLHKNIKDAVIKKLIDRLSKIKIGNSLSEDILNHNGPSMGPVVDKAQYDKIWGYINGAIQEEGLSPIYGGYKKYVAHTDPNGYFIPPTVFVDVPTSSKIWKEEIFGPVLCIREFTSTDEVIAEANDSIYGLAGAVFSKNLALCDDVTRRLRCGIVWKNCSQPAFIQAPWGGVKQSGFGRELGRWGLEEFLSVKQVTSCAAGYQWGLW